ncbi:uncharacterized protein BP01DRAFT_77250 [Aspergillus saccharolyticus JOP 1030-1]|uniref:Uncharacterized protein n=1 Tax=Aspergillus saccharolyticus JOP 1030-1 TaxID=1450539 RepID=A0A318ZYS3_9EURO|nr:hypothetical protein BP01DRAFT_77250 [Aspergillus saccharolyticus JOP 1030-1]PYH49443.1 hypothetical protein BP01DRAFT_77250 [Aspergillus saccharolyticus JOP 1030-1]
MNRLVAASLLRSTALPLQRPTRVVTRHHPLSPVTPTMKMIWEAEVMRTGGEGRSEVYKEIQISILCERVSSRGDIQVRGLS